MGIARKYIVQITQLKPSGVTTTSVVTTYDLTQSFAGTREDNSTYSYDSIDIVQLGLLEDTEYEQRVADFLNYIDIGGDDKDQLISDASFENPSCD